MRAGLGITVLPREMAPSDLFRLGPKQGLPELADTEIALMRALDGSAGSGQPGWPTSSCKSLDREHSLMEDQRAQSR